METFVIILEFVVIPVIAIAVGIAVFTRRRNDGGGDKPG
jgi:hypothetical protein